MTVHTGHLENFMPNKKLSIPVNSELISSTDVLTMHKTRPIESEISCDPSYEVINGGYWDRLQNYVGATAKRVSFMESGLFGMILAGAVFPAYSVHGIVSAKQPHTQRADDDKPLAVEEKRHILTINSFSLRYIMEHRLWRLLVKTPEEEKYEDPIWKPLSGTGYLDTCVAPEKCQIWSMDPDSDGRQLEILVDRFVRIKLTETRNSIDNRQVIVDEQIVLDIKLGCIIYELKKMSTGVTNCNYINFVETEYQGSKEFTSYTEHGVTQCGAPLVFDQYC